MQFALCVIFSFFYISFGDQRSLQPVGKVSVKSKFNNNTKIPSVGLLKKAFKEKSLLATLEDADPQTVREILSMLHGLLNDALGEVTALDTGVTNALTGKNTATTTHGNLVLDKEDQEKIKSDAQKAIALADAQILTLNGKITTANNELTAAKTKWEDAETAKTNGRQTLLDEIALIRQIIAMVDRLYVDHADDSCPNMVVGDGTGGTEVLVGETSSVQECVDLVKAAHPDANGLTMPPGGSGKCYAEIGMTGTNDNAAWKTCYIRDNSCPALAVGDGTGGSEYKVSDEATSVRNCVDLVRAAYPSANGLTIDPSGFGACYAEVGMTGNNGNAAWKHCYVR